MHQFHNITLSYAQILTNWKIMTPFVRTLRINSLLAILYIEMVLKLSLPRYATVSSAARIDAIIRSDCKRKKQKEQKPPYRYSLPPTLELSMHMSRNARNNTTFLARPARLSFQFGLGRKP